MANRAIKYRIYPTTEQRTLIAKTFGCCRKVWNLMLAEKQAYYQEHHKVLTVTPAKYKKEYPYLKEVDSLALANVQQNLQTAYKNCYVHHNAEPPKFKSKHRSKKSYTTNCQIPFDKKSGTYSQPTIRIENRKIHLPKVGDLKAVLHRMPDPSWKLKSATLSEDSSGCYYVSMLYEFASSITSVSKEDKLSAIGLDYKSDGLFMASNGHCANMPKYFRQSQKKLRHAQRALARKAGSHKGEPKSKNWLKQQRKVNKIYRHCANQRKDFLHKRSTEIANQYDLVCIEDLNMKAMANKKFGNGKATMDNGYGMFTAMLSYKLAGRGKYLVKVGKWYPSSQLCHKCGHRQKMPLTKRTYVCPDCGMAMDRDYNASLNIKAEGMRILLSA